MFRLLRNPFFIYILGFTLAFFVYALDWSEIYPSLTTEVKIFFTITFITFIFFAIAVHQLKLIRRAPATTKQKLITICFYLIIALYFLEFLYERDVPLLAKLMGRPGIDYKEFGIPLLHGTLISFNSFLIAHSFTVYMSTKRKKALTYYLLLYVPALFILNRSIIVFGLLTSLFIYMHFIGRIKVKNQLKLAVLAFTALFLFGVVGNLRSGGDYIYTQSKATKDFMESSMPKEFYWTYLYVASPLANFQNTINKKSVGEYDFMGFVFYENLPRIISKNLGGPLQVERKDLVRIVPWLTVGTTYARSFSYLGWYGPYLLFFSNLLVYLMVIYLVPRRSSYHTTTIGVLSVIVLLNIFTNMLIVTGISFQLAYCVIFAFFERKKIVLKTG
ncbi:O-antigen polymerase [Flagellimonas sp.]|uniref:O-antigen polymerase n=1 Tax=Flagellimonas sp. TaxID=2058762 RepID=UPI003B5ABD7F